MEKFTCREDEGDYSESCVLIRYILYFHCGSLFSGMLPRGDGANFMCVSTVRPARSPNFELLYLAPGLIPCIDMVYALPVQTTI